MTRPHRKPEPLSLPELLQRDRNAVTVYVALRWLAGGARQVNTTRAKITEATGLYRETITAAVTALHDGRWINRRRGYAVNRRWYRITFPSDGLFPWDGKTSSSARKKGSFPRAAKSRPSAVSKAREKPPKRAKRLSGEKPPNSLEGVGASYGPAPAPTGGAERTPALVPPVPSDSDAGPVRPIVEILGLNNG